jgi:hypothetical protein
MSDIDTSALDDDPVTQLARQRYEQSPFRTSLTEDWDTLTADERRPWYELAARQWLTAEPPAPPVVEMPSLWFAQAWPIIAAVAILTVVLVIMVVTG